MCDDAQLPHAYTVAIEIDPEALGLQEIRVNDISTTFTRPKNYLPGIVGGAAFARETWDTPMSDVRTIAIDDLSGELPKIQDATIKMYGKISRMCRRDLIWAGQYVYYVDMILPYLRKAGAYEKACDDYRLWEIDQRVSNYYRHQQARIRTGSRPAEDLLRPGLPAIRGGCRSAPLEVPLAVEPSPGAGATDPTPARRRHLQPAAPFQSVFGNNMTQTLLDKRRYDVLNAVALKKMATPPPFRDRRPRYRPSEHKLRYRGRRSGNGGHGRHFFSDTAFRMS